MVSVHLSSYGCKWEEEFAQLKLHDFAGYVVKNIVMTAPILKVGCVVCYFALLTIALDSYMRVVQGGFSGTVHEPKK